MFEVVEIFPLLNISSFSVWWSYSTHNNEKGNDFNFISDVRFLYLTPGNKDNYRELVDNPSTDVFTIPSQITENELNSICDPLIDRIKKGK